MYHCLAILADGSLVGWGGDWAGETRAPQGLSNVIAIAAGTQGSLALFNHGEPAIVRPPLRQTVYSGNSLTLPVSALGTGRSTCLQVFPMWSESQQVTTIAWP